MAKSVAGRPRVERADLPQWIKPQLTKLVEKPPEGSEWLHEIKFDGYRIHARLDRGEVRLLTRTGLDWTHKYPAIASTVSSLPARQAYLDGELCGVRPDGGIGLLPVRSPVRRRRKSLHVAADGAEGAARRLAVGWRLAAALLRSPDRARPRVS